MPLTLYMLCIFLFSTLASIAGWYHSFSAGSALENDEDAPYYGIMGAFVSGMACLLFLVLIVRLHPTWPQLILMCLLAQASAFIVPLLVAIAIFCGFTGDGARQSTTFRLTRYFFKRRNRN